MFAHSAKHFANAPFYYCLSISVLDLMGISTSDYKRLSTSTLQVWGWYLTIRGRQQAAMRWGLRVGPNALWVWGWCYHPKLWPRDYIGRRRDPAVFTNISEYTVDSVRVSMQCVFVHDMWSRPTLRWTTFCLSLSSTVVVVVVVVVVLKPVSRSFTWTEPADMSLFFIVYCLFSGLYFAVEALLILNWYISLRWI